ncbi:MAG: actin-binding WH2 domain-containing protein [Candidatus Eisenbacteria bacterium]|nr:actin-binding WH2 domain-containing protein [Candidatus Eisenbacteria bacterium]
MKSDSATHVTARSGASGCGLFLTQLLSDRERFFTDVAEEVGLGEKLGHATWTLLGLSALYGAAAGAYAGPLQSLSAAIKLPVLFVGTLAICFPAFFVIQVLVGSRLRFTQVLALVMGALALTAILLAAVVPITVFFLLTGANYYFLELLHVAIVLGAGFAGMAALHEGLTFACEKRGVYPRKAMTIMRAWAVLFAFVGVQMAWDLRPFVGDRGQPFQVFRHYEGNFYTGVVYSLQKLTAGEDESAVARRTALDREAVRKLFDSMNTPRPDSVRAGGR